MGFQGQPGPPGPHGMGDPGPPVSLKETDCSSQCLNVHASVIFIISVVKLI